MIKCVIIDDEPLARKLLSEYAEKVPYLELKGVYSSALDALDLINSGKVDLLFLDIQMPDITGVDFLRSLRTNLSVIFTTAHAEFALEGYELDVVDYLLKPFDFARFLRSVEKVSNLVPAPTSKEQKNDRDYLFLKEKNQLIKIKIADIYYIKGLKDYLQVVTEHKTHLVLMSMKAMLQKLPSHIFVRIHNSYIVSIDHISSIVSNKVRVKNELLPIGGTYRSSFFRRIDKLTDD